MSEIEIRTCPNCGGDLYGVEEDKFCTKCYHEDRV